MLGEGKQFTFSQVPIDLNDNYSPGDNQRGDGECKPGSSREMLLSPSQKDRIHGGNPGFGSWNFFGQSTAFLTNPVAEGSPKCQINNKQSSPAHREPPGPLTGWLRPPRAPEARPAQRQDRRRHFSGGAWNPQFQISWLLSICLANSYYLHLRDF